MEHLEWKELQNIQQQGASYARAQKSNL
jgi:hypothetical protein